MGASPDTLAKLAMEIQQDPSLKFLVSRGFIKWEQVLKKDGKGPDGQASPEAHGPRAHHHSRRTAGRHPEIHSPDPQGHARV